MTSRSGCILLVSLCGLLTLATSAAAECAWVLWAHWGGGLMKMQDGSLYNPVSRYEPVESYNAHDACMAAQRTFRLNPGWDRTICLPDTVDPRGQKGK
jgi:hypothetical protein